MDIKNYISSGIIEMYVMGVCDPQEKATLELLRLKHPEINNALLQFESELENNTIKNATTVPPQADDKLLKSLQSLQAPLINIAAEKTPVKKMHWLKLVAAASIILFAASSILNYTLYKKTKAQQLALTNAATSVTLSKNDYAILNNPTITPVAMYGVAPHSICRCTMFWDKRNGKAYIMIHHLVPSSPQKKYQLWAMVNDKPVSVGIINDAIRGKFIEVQNVPEGASAFKVTLEDAAGSTVPTEEEAYLYGRI